MPDEPLRIEAGTYVRRVPVESVDPSVRVAVERAVGRYMTGLCELTIARLLGDPRARDLTNAERDYVRERIFREELGADDV